MIPVVIWRLCHMLDKFILVGPCRFPTNPTTVGQEQRVWPCLPASLLFPLFKKVCRCAEWLERTLHSPQVMEGQDQTLDQKVILD